jgi:hypothetical protein
VRSPDLESAAALTSTVNEEHRSRVHAAKQIRTRLMDARQHVFKEAKAMFSPSPEDIKATQQQCVNEWIEHTKLPFLRIIVLCAALTVVRQTHTQ